MVYLHCHVTDVHVNRENIILLSYYSFNYQLIGVHVNMLNIDKNRVWF